MYINKRIKNCFGTAIAFPIAQNQNSPKKELETKFISIFKPVAYHHTFVFLSRTIYAPGSEICFGEIFVVGIELANFLLNRDILAFLCYELYSGCFW